MGLRRTAGSVTAELRRSGELWDTAPGLTGLRGAPLRLYRRLDDELRALAAAETGDEWLAPPAVTFDTLARADYFACFPQWLTAAAHLDRSRLDGVATARDPAAAATSALRPVPHALQPAACYHVYDALAGSRLDGPHCCTLAGTCWRHEGGRFASLERGWSFTMREVVLAGSAADVQSFRERSMAAGSDLARRLGLEPRIEEATDPFFAPTARGRALLQRVRALKHELLLPLGDGRAVAAASFNDHAEFFGTAFDIQLTDGTVAATGCAAYGVERWLLALLVEHGTDPRNWPLSIAQEETWARP